MEEKCSFKVYSKLKVYHSKITIQSYNQTKTVMARENQCQEVTNINKDEPTLMIIGPAKPLNFQWFCNLIVFTPGICRICSIVF